jgi:hypothetical protein
MSKVGIISSWLKSVEVEMRAIIFLRRDHNLMIWTLLNPLTGRSHIEHSRRNDNHLGTV